MTSWGPSSKLGFPVPLTPEQRAREEIDGQPEACGWAVQDFPSMNIHAGRGVVVVAGLGDLVVLTVAARTLFTGEAHGLSVRPLQAASEFL